MRMWPCLGWPCPHKLPRPYGGWSFYGSQDPELPVLSVMGPWGHRIFGTYSSFSPIMAEEKCVCGHVWGDPVPTNCRVLRADGHFTVARTLNYLYYQLWVPGAKGYLVHIAHFPHNGRTEMRMWPCLGWPCPVKLPRPYGGWSFYGSQDPVLPVLSVMGPWLQGLFGTYSSFSTIMAEEKCVCGHVWGDPVPTNCRVLRADGHFTVARALNYPYYQLWVPGAKGYLVHIAPLPP